VILGAAKKLGARMKLKIVILTVAMFLPQIIQAQLNHPGGLAFDSSGNLWVANSGDNQVLKLNPANGSVLATINLGLNNPQRIAFDRYGTLFVANNSSSNVTIYRNLQLIATVASSGIQNPLGIAAGDYDEFYVANNSGNSISVFNIDGELLETLTADQSGFLFTAPGALAIRGSNLYAGFGPGFGENAVISYNAAEFLTKNPAERRVYTDFVNTGPTGIAFDSSGNVYVSDFYSNTAVKFNSVGLLSLVISKGIAQPEGIAVDKSGNIFVSNATLNDITVYNAKGSLINTLK
jgi:YVTN family beta-propeller protein